MSAQPSLLSKAEPGQVILPSNNSQVQVVRDRSAFGLGKYWAYFIDGTRELIGGPGTTPSISEQIIPYAGDVSPNTTTYRFFANSATLDENNGNFTTTRSGNLTRLDINVPINTLATDTTFTIRMGSGINPLGDTPLQIIVPGGATGTFSILGTIPFSLNDRISLRVQAGAAGAGPSTLIFSAGLGLQ